MKIGLVQAAFSVDILANLIKLYQFAKEAKQKNCEVICFPECFLTGYTLQKVEELSLSTGSLVLDEVSAIAVTCEIDLLVGFMEQNGNRYYITHALFRANGTREYYRKTHLGKKEQDVFAQGNVLNVYSLSNGTCIGVQLCVEAHFPEITQTLALKGAEVIFAPHASPRVSGDRQQIWRKYIPARSYDNRVYVACCNLWDDEKFSGGCMVSNPQGEIICASFEEGENLFVCEVHLETVQAFRRPQDKRSSNFYPSKRRPDLYIISE